MVRTSRWAVIASQFSQAAIARFLLLSVLAMMLVTLWLPASAQITVPEISRPAGRSLPNGVVRIGNSEVTPVTFEGDELFRIASPAVPDRTNPGNQIPVEVRARRIEDNLNLIIALDPVRLQGNSRSYETFYDPETLTVGVATLDGQTVLVARDQFRTQPQILMTVTNQDAELYGQSQEELAEEWASLLQRKLRQALRDRLPAALIQQVNRVLVILLAMVGVSFLLWIPRRLLKRRKQHLEALKAAEERSRTTEPPSQNEEFSSERWTEFLVGLQRRLNLSQRVGILDFLRWLMFWVMMLVWVIGIGSILRILPYTRSISGRWLALPFVIVVTWFVTGFLNRVATLAIDRFAKVWDTQAFLSFEDMQRRSLRITTIAATLKGLKTFLIYAIGVVWALGELGIDTSSALAFGAIVALALSLASQNVIKDLVNGFLILLEDQYGIGDVITVGSLSGFVENMNLRITQLRNAQGRLITIPNSSIVQVENLTRIWARVDFAIEVAYETNARKALEILNQVAFSMYDDPIWRPTLIDPPEVLGIDELSNNGVLIRVWLKTQPLDQWRVGREFRLRVKEVFDQNEIAIGTPRYEVAGAETNHKHDAISGKAHQKILPPKKEGDRT